MTDKYDDHRSAYITGNMYRYFRKFNRGKRSEHDRSADEFNNILGGEG